MKHVIVNTVCNTVINRMLTQLWTCYRNHACLIQQWQCIIICEWRFNHHTCTFLYMLLLAHLELTLYCIFDVQINSGAPVFAMQIIGHNDKHLLAMTIS